MAKGYYKGFKDQINTLYEKVNDVGKSKNIAKRDFHQKSQTLGIRDTPKTRGDWMGVHSKNTEKAYKSAWESCYKFCASEFGVKYINQLKPDMIERYLENKIENTRNLNTLGREFAALVKLGVALDRNDNRKLDSKSRIAEVKKVESGQKKEMDSKYMTKTDKVHQVIERVKEKYSEVLNRPDQYRAYTDRETLTEKLQNPNHVLAAKIVAETGMRAAEFSRITKIQLDDKNRLMWNSKGGKFNKNEISQGLADKLREHFKENKGMFKVDLKAFRADLKQASYETNQRYNEIHGLRWNFAQEMYIKQINDGKSEKAAMALVSKAMGHNRISITKYYLGLS